MLNRSLLFAAVILFTATTPCKVPLDEPSTDRQSTPQVDPVPTQKQQDQQEQVDTVLSEIRSILAEPPPIQKARSEQGNAAVVVSEIDDFDARPESRANRQFHSPLLTSSISRTSQTRVMRSFRKSKLFLEFLLTIRKSHCPVLTQPSIQLRVRTPLIRLATVSERSDLPPGAFDARTPHEQRSRTPLRFCGNHCSHESIPTGKPGRSRRPSFTVTPV